VYAVFGWTETVWLHFALSLELAAPDRALVPPWTGLDTTEPSPPEQVHGLVLPLSKPALDSTFAACAVVGRATAPATASAADPMRARRRGLAERLLRLENT
jgi:hypothetical protein